MKKVLYIYDYDSDHKSSKTMNVMKEVMKELGYELVCVEYNQEYPCDAYGFNRLEDYIEKNNIKHVIGYSLGGFIALCIINNVKKLVINPCLRPDIDLPRLGYKGPINHYVGLVNWLSHPYTRDVTQVDDIMGLFGDKDELFSYYDQFKKEYPRTYYINSTHRPEFSSFTDDIKNKISEFFK